MTSQPEPMSQSLASDACLLAVGHTVAMTAVLLERQNSSALAASMAAASISEADIRRDRNGARTQANARALESPVRMSNNAPIARRMQTFNRLLRQNILYEHRCKKQKLACSSPVFLGFGPEQAEPRPPHENPGRCRRLSW